MIDVLRRNLRFDNQSVGPRHNLHQCVALADYAADRVDLELINGACLRRAYFGVLEFIFGRIRPLLQFRDLCLSFPQVLEHLGPKILIKLEDLQLGLGDLAA